MFFLTVTAEKNLQLQDDLKFLLLKFCFCRHLADPWVWQGCNEEVQGQPRRIHSAGASVGILQGKFAVSRVRTAIRCVPVNIIWYNDNVCYSN